MSEATASSEKKKARWGRRILIVLLVLVVLMVGAYVALGMMADAKLKKTYDVAVEPIEIPDSDDARKRGVQHAVRELLPVFDNLERATTHIGPEADAKSMADGLRMVLKQFIDVIAKVGVERVEAVGSPFDPNVHESIQYEHSE